MAMDNEISLPFDFLFLLTQKKDKRLGILLKMWCFLFNFVVKLFLK